MGGQRVIVALVILMVSLVALGEGPDELECTEATPRPNYYYKMESQVCQGESGQWSSTCLDAPEVVEMRDLGVSAISAYYTLLGEMTAIAEKRRRAKAALPQDNANEITDMETRLEYIEARMAGLHD